ncbi:hypothetical protein [Methanolapillus ohkumae]|uniref:CRISPR type III-B/RAMP module-associated protein Cmr5 n=1 Tax=Methanolapillus ohkumae TaxID=3028298 RepID=A0AA96V5M1_9EURY|nr:hypothetical protein MsAm2_00810 [Methanosarcinaceae archaeon Am2]
MDLVNLDKEAAACSQKIVQKCGGNKDLENMITKSLGVLQEQGVYALILYLSSQKGIANNIKKELIELLVILKINNVKKTEDFPEKVLSDLDDLFLVRDLYEQTLIYARYGAKAAQSKKVEEGKPATKPEIPGAEHIQG